MKADTIRLCCYTSSALRPLLDAFKQENCLTSDSEAVEMILRERLVSGKQPSKQDEKRALMQQLEALQQQIAALS